EVRPRVSEFRTRQRQRNRITRMRLRSRRRHEGDPVGPGRHHCKFQSRNKDTVGLDGYGRLPADRPGRQVIILGQSNGKWQEWRGKLELGAGRGPGCRGPAGGDGDDGGDRGKRHDPAQGDGRTPENESTLTPTHSTRRQGSPTPTTSRSYAPMGACL